MTRAIPQFLTDNTWFRTHFPNEKPLTKEELKVMEERAERVRQRVLFNRSCNPNS